MNSKGITKAAHEYLARIKQMNCGVCDAPGPSDAHHLKQGLHFVCIPLCRSCHMDGFNGWHGQRRIWNVMKKDELIVLSETIEKLAKGEQR